jgi:hypothetical protein
MYIASISRDIMDKQVKRACGRFSTFPISQAIKFAIHNSRRRGVPRQFLQPQDRHPAPARSSRISEGTPLEKNATCAPARGQGGTSARHRPSRGTAMWPAGLPQPPPLGGWPPQAPTTAREANTRASAAPRCPNQNQNPNKKNTRRAQLPLVVCV